MEKNRTVGMVLVALVASLLLAGCGGGEAASPAGGSGDSATQEPMKETSTPMQGEKRRMQDGEGESMPRGDRKDMQGGEGERMAPDDGRSMQGRDGQHSQRGEREPM